MSPIDADAAFFSSLVDADAPALRALLTDDFVLVDVMRGGVIPGAALVDVVGSGEMVFESVERIGDPQVRTYGAAAVVVGETRMHGRFGAEPFAAHSRYTHVFVPDGERWRLASAQGTPIVEGG